MSRRPRDVLATLPTQLTFDHVVLVEQGRQPRQLVLVQFASPGLRIDARLVAQLARDLRTHAVQVRQRDDRRPIVRNVNTQQTRHSSIAPRTSLLSRSAQANTHSERRDNIGRMHAAVQRADSTLALLVAGIAADHEDHAPAADDLAVLTDSLDAGADFHDCVLRYLVCANGPKHLSICATARSVQAPPDEEFISRFCAAGPRGIHEFTAVSDWARLRQASPFASHRSTLTAGKRRLS